MSVARELMTEAPDAGEIVNLMLDNTIGVVPVTDADRTLVGIVSCVDVRRTFRHENNTAE